MKAIITDLDRTLLRTDKSLSARTLEALKKCHSRGILVMAASARPLRNIEEYHLQIGFDAIAATCGAVIQLPGGIETIGIPPESSKIILQNLLRYPDIFLSAETSTGLFSNRDIPQWNPIVYDGFPFLPPDAIPFKLLASSEHKAVYQDIAHLLTPDCYHTVAGDTLIQIMHRTASKWQAVQRMLAHFDLTPKDAVYFGDDNDDIECIAHCGTGVAMANAIPAVLSVADVIVPGNDEDGVAQFIEQNIR